MKFQFLLKTIYVPLIVTGVFSIFLSGVCIAEDIILTGNQVLLIENMTYTNKGNINLYDNSKLIIRNSTFNFVQDYHEQYWIYINDSASFIIEDGSILTSDYRFYTSMDGSSKVTVNNSVALNMSSGRGAIFQPNQNSILEITNSNIDGVGDLAGYSASSKATITIQNSTMEAVSLVFPATSSVTFKWF